MLIPAVFEVDRTLTGRFGAFSHTRMALALEKSGLCCGSLPVVEVSDSNTGQSIERLSRGLLGTFRPKQPQYRQA